MSDNPIVRPAVPADLLNLLPIAQRFIEESGLPYTYDEGISKRTFLSAIESDDFIVLVQEYDGVITGGILAGLERDFCVELSAYVVKMYVEREFRGLGTADALMVAYEEEIKRRGVLLSYASATAEMGDRVEKLFVKLFERFGYRVLGRILVKEI